MKKRIKFSQVFLKNQSYLKKIASALDISENDIIVEIGGGRGELTQFLTKAKKLFVYEIDKKLVNILKEKFKSFENVFIINQDFLKADLSEYKESYKLVGNIPYEITGKIFRKVLNEKNKPKLLVFTLQKEVGEKIIGKGKISFWNIWIKTWGAVKNLGIIKKENFYPIPKVDSMIIKIEFYEKPLVKDPEKFVKFLKILFNSPNKKLKHKIKNLPENYKEKRIFELNFEEIKKLYENLFDFYS